MMGQIIQNCLYSLRVKELSDRSDGSDYKYLFVFLCVCECFLRLLRGAAARLVTHNVAPPGGPALHDPSDVKAPEGLQDHKR